VSEFGLSQYKETPVAQCVLREGQIKRAIQLQFEARRTRMTTRWEYAVSDILRDLLGMGDWLCFVNMLVVGMLSRFLFLCVVLFSLSVVPSTHDLLDAFRKKPPLA
jgi:hypothetical protein